MLRQRRTKVEWPAWRYGPDGESEVFDSAEDVPAGWGATPSLAYVPREASPEICKESTIKALEDFGVVINPTWGTAHLRKMLKELTND